jgi:L-alanine-DL-glutamate epimerase-like enolase superfamily enzyme
MFDVYMSWDSETTVMMTERLLEFNIHWFEDVLTPDHLVESAALRPLVKPALIAGGEHEFTHHGFGEIERAGAFDVWQPDITWCGGSTAGLRIVEMGRSAGVQVVPHRGGEVWGLHLIAASACEDFAEVLPGVRGAGRETTCGLESPRPAEATSRSTMNRGLACRRIPICCNRSETPP